MVTNIFEAASPNFSLEALSSIPSFKGRLAYCKQELGIRWGTGSSRTVFDIDDEKVLKLALNEKGIAQNEAEHDSSSGTDMTANVYDCDDDYLWLVSERCIPAKASDFPHVVGEDFKTVQSFIRSTYLLYSRYGKMFLPHMTDTERHRLVDNNEWFERLSNYMCNYEPPYGDLCRISSWGLVQRNGETTLVILDSGLDFNVLNTYYGKGLREEKDIDPKIFIPHDTLNVDLWKNGDTIDSQVRLRLMDIADDFVENLGVPWVKPEDIVLTGSSANYNWNKFSDIDLHIIVDFSKVHKNTDFVKNYFDSQKFNWNNSHKDLEVKGLPVEISVEDSNEPAAASAVYSLEKNEWVKKPKKMSREQVNLENVKKKFDHYSQEIDSTIEKAEKESDTVKKKGHYDMLGGIWDELKKMRKASLKTSKMELADGNLVWKMLRACGYIEKLYKALDKGYDVTMSLDENFTYDDEVAAIYQRIFNEGGFSESDDDYKNVHMWLSLSYPVREEIIARSRFSGGVMQNPNENDDLVLYKERDLNVMIDWVSENIDNAIYSGSVNEDKYYTLGYKTAPFLWSTTDALEDNPHIKRGLRVRWNNRLERTGLLFILGDTEDVVGVNHTPNAYQRLLSDAGIVFYKNGRRMAGGDADFSWYPPYEPTNTLLENYTYLIEERGISPYVWRFATKLANKYSDIINTIPKGSRKGLSFSDTFVYNENGDSVDCYCYIESKQSRDGIDAYCRVSKVGKRVIAQLCLSIDADTDFLKPNDIEPTIAHELNHVLQQAAAHSDGANMDRYLASRTFMAQPNAPLHAIGTLFYVSRHFERDAFVGQVAKELYLKIKNREFPFSGIGDSDSVLWLKRGYLALQYVKGFVIDNANNVLLGAIENTFGIKGRHPIRRVVSKCEKDIKNFALKIGRVVEAAIFRAVRDGYSFEISPYDIIKDAYGYDIDRIEALPQGFDYFDELSRITGDDKKSNEAV